jgi:hypothetical protein
MKTLTKITSLLLFAAIVAQTSCSVRYRTAHPRRHKKVIVVPMNEKKTQDATVGYLPSEQAKKTGGEVAK